jgi:hypothetical protein
MLVSTGLTRRRFSVLATVILVLVRFGIAAVAMPTNEDTVPIGSILDANGVRGGPELTSAGATIYNGDRLETHGADMLRVRLHQSQIYLRPSTLAEFHVDSNGFSATLIHGTVIVSSREGQTFRLLSDGAIICPARAEATVAQVTWVNPSELLLSTSRGAIQVSLDGETTMIEAGNSYRMLIQPDDSGSQDNGDHGKPRPVHAGQRRIILVLVPAVAAAVGIVVWRALVSPAGP